MLKEYTPLFNFCEIFKNSPTYNFCTKFTHPHWCVNTGASLSYAIHNKTTFMTRTILSFVVSPFHFIPHVNSCGWRWLRCHGKPIGDFAASHYNSDSSSSCFKDNSKTTDNTSLLSIRFRCWSMLVVLSG